MVKVTALLLALALAVPIATAELSNADEFRGRGLQAEANLTDSLLTTDEDQSAAIYQLVRHRSAR